MSIRSEVVIINPSTKTANKKMNHINYDIKFDTANFHVEVSTENEHGWFEHLEYGDEYGGSLTFERDNLVDYDGTFSLPQEVARGLVEHKLTVDSEYFE